MANLKRVLSAKGATFENSFASFPLCCPSRATLLTGQYSHNHGVVGNSIANGLSRLDQTNTLAVWLQRAGYATAFVGKYLNGYGRNGPRVIPPGWDEWYAGVKLAYLGHSMNWNGRIVRYSLDPASYQTDVYAGAALDVIRRRAASPQPFFLWLSFFAPHFGAPREAEDPPWPKTPMAAPRHQGLFASENRPPTPAFNEDDLSDKPAAVRVRAPLGPEHVEAVAAAYRQQLESLLAVDEAVESLVSTLRASGELDTTLIIFTSDNGLLQGEHRVVNEKVLLYEPSIRVPLIVRGPGVPSGVRLRQPVANVDLAPTIVEAAGALPERTMDGRSLFPLFADPTLEWGRDLLLERGPGADGFGDRLTVGLRTPRYVYAEHTSGERELYDLEVDPDELRSVHDDPGYAPVAAELSRRLSLLRDCSGAACYPGPQLDLALAGDPGCVRMAEVVGLDARFVSHIDFRVGEHGVRDEAAPFTQAVTPALGLGDLRLRALAVLDDGRRLTLDATVRPCT